MLGATSPQEMTLVIKRIWRGRIAPIWTGHLEPMWKGHRKLVIAVGAIAAAVVLVAAGTLIWLLPGKAPQASPSPGGTQIAEVSPSSSDTTLPSYSPGTFGPASTPLPSGWEYADLDGVGAPANLAHRLALAVSIGDNAVARPQSGFSSASIVYQSYEEYGEVRYMMVFQEGTSSAIGGVRSARPWFVRWAAEYKALYGHDGGDTKVRTVTIPAMANYIYNMDPAAGGACPYHRITTRMAPHNEYTNTADLIRCAATKGIPATYQGLPSRPFVADAPAADRPQTQAIFVPYRTVSVSYQYYPENDSYVRILDGKLQIDPANNQQVIARNIVVMFQPLVQDYVDTNGVPRVNVANVGSGKAIVFKEGKAITGTWKKDSDSALTRYYDDSGKEIPFVRGEIFIQSVPPDMAVTYK
jgi:hypothetical protein